jgi:hypothetical protein
VKERDSLLPLVAAHHGASQSIAQPPVVKTYIDPVPAPPARTLRDARVARKRPQVLLGALGLLTASGIAAGFAAWFYGSKREPTPRPTVTASTSAADREREARARLAAIRDAVVRSYRTQKELCPSGPPVPASPPKATAIEARADHFRAPGWSCLGYSHAGPQRFQVEYRKGGPYKGTFRGGVDPGPQGFEISAEADTDGDGITSLYVLTGVVSAGEVVVRDEVFVAAPNE